MDFNTTLDILINDLKEAREIIDDLRNYPGVPRLQIELAKSKCKNAEEIISLLKILKMPEESGTGSEQGIPSDKGPARADLVEIIPEATEEKPAEIFAGKSEEKPAEIIPEKEAEAESGEMSMHRAESGEAVPEKKVKEKKAEAQIIADKFGKVSNIVDEQIGTHKRDDDISSMLKTKPVGNLKDAIGINDKFLYIREIFYGNQSLYEEAISKLNSAASLDEARSLIFTYTGEDEDNEALIQLLSLVKRKLLSDG